MVESPETGLRVREMTVTAGDPAYQVAVRTRTRTSAGVARFPGTPPFGYLNVTHSVPNANVTNAIFSFTLDRTRLRERNVAAENVSLYRYRTWQRLQTRVIAQNRTHVTYHAVSPGLSEFAVAPTVGSTTTATPTPTPTATATPEPTDRASTPTPSPTPAPGTDGSAPGFGVLAAALALLGLAALARRR